MSIEDHFLRGILPHIPQNLINDGFHLFLAITSKLFPNTKLFESFVEDQIKKLSLASAKNDVQLLIDNISNYLELLPHPSKTILPFLLCEFETSPCKPFVQQVEVLEQQWLQGGISLTIPTLITRVLDLKSTLEQSGKWTEISTPNPNLPLTKPPARYSQNSPLMWGL